MLSRFFRASSDFARRTASQSAAWAVFARDTVSGFLTTAHHTLVLVGLLAIGALCVMFVKPDIADQFKQLSPFASAPSPKPVVAENSLQPMAATLDIPVGQRLGAVTPAALTAGDNQLTGNPNQQQWVTDWLSKRYRVASDAINMLVSAAYTTARETKLDPLLILSVMAIESGFNPFAESPVGAQGLMQVMSKVHRDKFEDHGGVQAALNPVANIKVGSLILKDYVTRGGSVEAGLKLYVGAGALDTDFGYGAKVLAEYHRLKDVAMGKKVPIYTTYTPPAAPAPQKQPVKTEAAEEKEVPAATDSNQIAIL